MKQVGATEADSTEQALRKALMLRDKTTFSVCISYEGGEEEKKGILIIFFFFLHCSKLQNSPLREKLFGSKSIILRTASRSRNYPSVRLLQT